jgi:hypothetical protein
MTPPRGIRNFLTGASWPAVDLSLWPAANGQATQGLTALHNQAGAEQLEQAQAIDRFSWGPAQRYRPALLESFHGYSTAELESFIPRLLTQGREGQRVSYYDALRIHVALLERVTAEHIPALTRRMVAVVHEYANALSENSGISVAERLRYLFAASRIVHSFLERLQNPVGAVAGVAQRETLRNLLSETLDGIDAQLQGYYAQLQRTSDPELPRLQGVMAWVALRRSRHQGNQAEQRRQAVSLFDYLSNHLPSADDEAWQARTERSLLEDPRALADLGRFDGPAPVEMQAVGLNALALELLSLAAASLDRANEESEASLRRRYQQLNAVVTAVILRHPSESLEQLLSRLRNPQAQSEFMADLQRAQSENSELATMLREAQGGQGFAELLVAARQGAEHLETLRHGLGQRLLSRILEENRRSHPLRRLDEQIANTPGLARELRLPAAGTATELFRRGAFGRQQVAEFQAQHPELRVQALRDLLEPGAAGSRAVEDFSRECLSEFQNQLESAPDPELFARYALFRALEEDREIAPGLRIPREIARQAWQSRGRIEGAGFRTRRVLGHLFSSSNLVGLGLGILATEFLPTLLIARAGTAGRLGFEGMELVSGGALTWRSSLLTGLGTGLGMSALGSALSTWERRRLGLQTHWGRDFLGSAALNLVTFGATLPFAHWLRGRLAPEMAESLSLGAWSWEQRLALHAGTVAFGGGLSLGLGIAGRGLVTGEWHSSPEEVAENVASLLMWEGGSAALRWGRGVRNPAAALGPNRALRVAELGARMIEHNPRLAEHREWLQRRIAREELHFPGSLERYFMALMMGQVPTRIGIGYRARLGMLAPGNLPPVPVAPQPPVAVILLERPAAPQIQAEVETPATAGTAETAPSQRPPLEVQETPFRLRVQASAQHVKPEDYHYIPLPSLEFGQDPIVLGRGDFPFLSREDACVLSRSHFELRRSADGYLEVRNLSRSSWGGITLEGHGSVAVWPETQVIDSERWTSFNHLQTLLLGNQFEPIIVRLDREYTPQRVSLEPGARANLNGAQLIRSEKDSLFRILVFGDMEVGIQRSIGDNAFQMRRFVAGDNPLAGEIGEVILLDVTREGQRREYRIFLDTPDRPADWLPQVLLQYHQGGQQLRLQFRSTEAQLAFGKAFQPELFSAQWISRRHFTLRVVSHLGQPRYLLTADSRFGLLWGGQRLQPNQSALLHSGIHELGFLMNEQSTAVDGPLLLHLPPIEGVFPEWGVEPLAQGHDRGMPPVPPPLPTSGG